MFQVWKNGPLCLRLSIQVENRSGKYSHDQQLEDDSKEEWVVELCLVMIEPIKEAEEVEAMLPVLKEIKEKKLESMGGHSRKDQFMVTDELQSFEDKGEPKRKPNPKYANVTVTKDDNIKKPSTYKEASQIEEWRKAMEEEIQA